MTNGTDPPTTYAWSLYASNCQITAPGSSGGTAITATAVTWWAPQYSDGNFTGELGQWWWPGQCALTYRLSKQQGDIGGYPDAAEAIGQEIIDRLLAEPGESRARWNVAWDKVRETDHWAYGPHIYLEWTALTDDTACTFFGIIYDVLNEHLPQDAAPGTRNHVTREAFIEWMEDVRQRTTDRDNLNVVDATTFEPDADRVVDTGGEVGEGDTEPPDDETSAMYKLLTAGHYMHLARDKATAIVGNDIMRDALIADLDAAIDLQRGAIEQIVNATTELRGKS